MKVIVDMDTQKTGLSFSSTPGCRERHLLRQYNNPLFGKKASSITQVMVDQAHQDDLKEYEGFLSDFNTLLLEISQLEGQVETELILELKERIDRMYDLSTSFGNDNSKYKQALMQLYEVIMKIIRQYAADDDLAMSELNKEQAARTLHLELVEYKLVSDLLRQESPILEEDLVPTLLSEKADSVGAVMNLFDSSQQQALRNKAQALIKQVEAQNKLTENTRLAFAAMQQVG